jgi:hypothetical protein
MTGPGPTSPTRYCRQCQYFLDGLTENRCPECGTPFEPGDPSTFQTVPRDPRQTRAYRHCWYSLICLVGSLVLSVLDASMVNPQMALPTIITAVPAAGFALSACRLGSGLTRVAALLLLTISLGLVLLFAYGMATS